jgi:hypothetical protein
VLIGLSYAHHRNKGLRFRTCLVSCFIRVVYLTEGDDSNRFNGTGYWNYWM